MHLLHFMRVEIEDILVLHAYEVQRAARPAPHNPRRLGPSQDLLQLRDVARVHLHQQRVLLSSQDRDAHIPRKVRLMLLTH